MHLPYINDVKNRLKENTWLTKEHIIRTKILPYFGKLKISEISTKEIITWQNEMLAYRDKKKKPYSQTYLKTLHNQLSAIFNHAVRYYELRSNPAAKVGNMGSEEHKEMLFWTREEYKKFSFEIHIDFVPFTTGSKRGLETRVSLKQALAAQGFKGGTRSDTEWNQWVQSEKEQLAAVMERYGIEWEHKGTHEKHLSVLEYKKQEREKEIEQLDNQLAEKKDEFVSVQNRIQNYDNGTKVITELEQRIENDSEYQLPDPPALMSAKSYKMKFVEPLIKKLKAVIKEVFFRYYKARDDYNRLNVTNGTLYRDNEKLTKINAKLTGENENLRAENRDYKLLRKVFGSKQIDNLLEQAREKQQSNQREKRFRNTKYER